MIESKIRFPNLDFPCNDSDIGKLSYYYGFANSFGWTPEQIDNIDIVTLEGLSFIHSEVNRVQAEEVRRSARR